MNLSEYPDRLVAKDMAAIFRVTLKRFYAQDAEGAYDFALNRPRIGRKSWSRDRVQKYFDGTLRGLTSDRKAS
jgi:hypothetical protein